MLKKNMAGKKTDIYRITQGHLLYRKLGKRLIDILFSGLALIILSPLLLILMLLVRVIHGSPVFFTPTRPGKNEKIFKLYKFRTMSNATDKEGKLLPEKDRVTRLGKFLRATSLDEIPELINIFIGDMSIVGPRPLAMKYLPYYSETERIRHTVRPGLTGLAQISGRNKLPWPQRFEKDLEYVRDMSLTKDIMIVLETVGKIFGDQDVTVPGTEKNYQFDTYRVIEEEGKTAEKISSLSVPEIGGSFWIDERESILKDESNSIIFPEVSDSAYTLSGRSAIALALKDAMKEKNIRKAYVPSYISFSMLQPFIQEGIEYKYYKVLFHQGKVKYVIDRRFSCDVFLEVDYFGLDNSDLNKYITFFKKRGCIVIEDITHNLFNEKVGIEGSDYYVASVRKWIAVCSGGWLGKTKGSIRTKPDIEGNNAVEKMRTAMYEKKDYIEGLTLDKTGFLEKMSQFESDLVQVDSMLQIDNYSLDILEKTDVEYVKKKRRENAQALYNKLSGIKEIEFLNSIEEIEKNVPLFVPICLEPRKRNQVRDALREKGMFCPVHWPETMAAPQGIRKQELSLVCDQRYEPRDMEIMADVIREALQG